MPQIRSLRPNVTRQEALEQFTTRGPLGFARSLAYGPLRSIADFYIPFRVFEVAITNSGKTDHRLVAIESVIGMLDLYQFEHLPQDREIMDVTPRNCLEPRLEDDPAKKLLVEKLRRVLFSKGFFKLRNLEISATPLPGDLHVPYWIGFRGRGERARITALDAMRRTLEGAKVPRLLEQWLESGIPVSEDAIS